MNRRGFTLLEMTIAIAIIILLVSFVFVTVGRVRASADQTKSLNALRQMMVGYTGYYKDNEGRLMPGFPGANLTGDLMVELGLNYPGSRELSNAKLPHLRPTTNTAFLVLDDARTYVFRLAPYLDNSWQTMCAEYSQTAMSALGAEYEAGRYGGLVNGTWIAGDIGIAIRPSFGLNSIFLGGDTLHGSADQVIPYHPWNTGAVFGSNDFKIATRFSQVKNASTLIVFAPATVAEPTGSLPYSDDDLGYFEIRAPFTVYDRNSKTWSNRQWYIGSEDTVIVDAIDDFHTDEGGIPVTRKESGTLPVVHLDGSTEPADLTAISENMRWWAPTPDR